jgi:hypothetical protein
MCYQISSSNHRKTRSRGAGEQPGVLAVQPAGADLHLFPETPQHHVAEKLRVTPFGFQPDCAVARRRVHRADRANRKSAMQPNRSGPAVHIDKLVKRFGDFVAVDNVNLDVRRAKSSASWAPTAPANPPPSASCAACWNPPPAAPRSGGRDVATQPEDIKPAHRLHVAEVLALRRSDGGREHRLFQRHLRRSARRRGGAARLRSENGGLEDRAPP